MTPTHDQIVTRVTELVGEQLGRLAEDISPDTDRRGIEGVDSGKPLRVIAKVEKEFDIMLEDEDVFGVSSINNLVALIERESTAGQ